MTPRERLVLGVHARRPGWTRRAFEPAGSYDLLAREVPRGDVLEVGCGDGALLERLIARGHAPARLVALDLSADELARLGVPVARLRARAQALPFATACFDTIVSHLVWMLVPDPAAMVSEAVRVLRPGGRFVALIGGGPTAGDDAYTRLLALAPRRATPLETDRRLRSTAGIASLLASFTDVTQTDHHLDLSGPLARVHASLTADYGFEDAPVPLEDLVRACADLVQHDGTVPCRVHVRLVSGSC